MPISVRSVDMTHREWLHLNERRFHIRRVWGAFFRDWDVLLCPVIATAALPHMQQGETWERSVTVNGRTIPYNDMLFWPGITCAFHLPASTAPIGMTEAGSADRRADRRAVPRRSHHDPRRRTAGTAMAELRAAAGLGMNPLGVARR